MLTAYNGAASFLRLTPGMAMAGLSHIRRIGPVAALGSDCRQALREQLCCASDERLVLIAFGGIDMQLPIAEWPPVAGVLFPRFAALVETGDHEATQDLLKRTSFYTGLALLPVHWR